MKDELHRDTRRRFEQWARNPFCRANTISAVHNVPMSEVARRQGVVPTMGQSPFAIARGQSFERALFRRGGESLLAALKDAGVVPPRAQGLADFRLRMSGGKLGSLDAARAATSEMLAKLARQRPRSSDPWLVAGATVRIPGGVMLPEALLILDVLVVRHDTSPRTLIVGEIKTYPDRGGYTDPGELAMARAQAGVYVHGLELVLEELGVHEHFDVSAQGFLVLTRPGFNRPSVRAGEDLRYQAARARRGFALLRESAAAMPKGHGHPSPDDVIAAEIRYGEACVSFCDLAPLCRERSLAEGDASVLGDDVARFLGEVSLHRAVELMEGSPPKTPAEQDVARPIREAEELRQVR